MASKRSKTARIVASACGAPPRALYWVSWSALAVLSGLGYLAGVCAWGYLLGLGLGLGVGVGLGLGVGFA